ncbi:hypothetical protein [Deinococcus arcticus]|uniref:hypothetical protein n=1 Tax=Deinococcus arcticus TaxID=2136176 RepID=UPI0018EC4DA9|nr:hypothetical protein [Deinococcus arcticus]
MDARDRLLSLLAAQAEGWGFTEEKEGGWGPTFQRKVAYGIQSLEYAVQQRQNGCLVSVTGRMAFQVVHGGEPIELAFRSVSSRLGGPGPDRWPLSTKATETKVHRIAAEIEASCTQVLLPFLNRVSTPQGLLTFMAEEYEPLMLVSPSLFLPFRRAALVCQTLLPPYEAAAALAQLCAAEHTFRARWEARGT